MKNEILSTNHNPTSRKDPTYVDFIQRMLRTADIKSGGAFRRIDKVEEQFLSYLDWSKEHDVIKVHQHNLSIFMALIRILNDYEQDAYRFFTSEKYMQSDIADIHESITQRVHLMIDGLLNNGLKGEDLMNYHEITSNNDKESILLQLGSKFSSNESDIREMHYLVFKYWIENIIQYTSNIQDHMKEFIILVERGVKTQLQFELYGNYINFLVDNVFNPLLKLFSKVVRV